MKNVHTIILHNQENKCNSLHINYYKIISHNSLKFTDKGNEYSENFAKSTKQLLT